MKVTRSGTKGTPNSMHGTQLSRLSSVLNGLEYGASAMRRRAQQLMRAVRSGTYTVDALKLSRRIVGDTLASA
jgi:anti-sigma28 factor (negative regulator of flagellin synthesis)